jgi:outer membrane immunogenic protein
MSPLAGFAPWGVATSLTGSQSLDTFGTVRGRLGFTPFDRSLVYFTGGAAYGHASSSMAIVQADTGGGLLPNTFNSSFGSASRTLVGWTIGGGWEWAFASNWSFKAEYLYYDLGNLNFTANSITGISGSAARWTGTG